MAKKISEMTDGAPAVGTDEAEFRRGSTNIRLALSAVATYVNGLLTSALALLAPLASPALTGTPTAPTASPGTNTTQLATTAFVDAVRALLAPLASPALTGTPTAPTASPGTSTTQVATTAFVEAARVILAAADALKADIASPAFTGTPTAPTASPGTSTTQVATTAFVDAVRALLAPLASPALTGAPTAPTASPGTNTTQLATTAFVEAARVVLAAADALKADLASPAFTGTPTAPTATAGDRSTKLATTNYVDRDRWRRLASGGAPIPLTGTTSETDYVLVTVPGGAMGPNGMIRITTLVSTSSTNANAKNIRYRFGGSAFQNFSVASIRMVETMRRVTNRNSQSSQVIEAPGALTYATSTEVPATAAVNTAVDFDIRITGLLGNAADTMTLESYLIEILYGA